MKWREVRENKDTLVKALQLIGAGMNQKCMKKNKRKKLILLAKASVARFKKFFEKLEINSQLIMKNSQLHPRQYHITQKPKIQLEY